MPEMLTNEQHTINGGGEAAVEVDSLAGLNGLGAGDSVEGQGPPVPNPDKTDEGMTVSGLSGEPLTNAEAAGEAASESAAAVQGLLYDEHSHTPGRHSHDDQPADTAEPAVMGEAQVPGGEDEGQVGVQHGTDLGTVPSLPGLEAGAAVNEGMDSGDHLQHLKNGEEVWCGPHCSSSEILMGGPVCVTTSSCPAPSCIKQTNKLCLLFSKEGFVFSARTVLWIFLFCKESNIK